MKRFLITIFLGLMLIATPCWSLVGPWDVQVVDKVYSTANPGAGDIGYEPGTIWINQTGNRAYVLIDVTGGVADWNQMDSVAAAETDPIVGAINGIVEADGAGNISAATAGVDYLAPAGSGAALSGIPLDSDFGSNGIMERTGAGTYGIATEGTDYYGPGGTDVADGDVADDITITNLSQVADVTIAVASLNAYDDGLTTQILVGGGAGVVPAWGADIPTAVTIGGAYVYRGSGTDVPVADGGTGASTVATARAALGINAVEDADAALTVLGHTHVRGDEDRVSYHVGTGGEVAGEVTVSVLKQLSMSVDPGAWYDSNTELFIFEVHADVYPNGIIIDEWKLSCNVAPTPEIDADLRRAAAWIGLGSANDIDEIDTSSGVSTEDTDANINGGSAVAAGQVIYIGFDADPEGTCTQMHFTMIFHAEED